MAAPIESIHCLRTAKPPVTVERIRGDAISIFDAQIGGAVLFAWKRRRSGDANDPNREIIARV
jgi:hypothetical protein